MRRSLVKFSESEPSNHTPSLADFTTTTPELKFSVHTRPGTARPAVGGRRTRDAGNDSMRAGFASDAVVMGRIVFQNPAQMFLAQDNDVVQTLSPDRSDQPFGKAILPGRGWRGRLVPDAHGAQSARDDAAIDPVAISDEVVRSLIPRKCFRYLTCNPVCTENSNPDVMMVKPAEDRV